LTLVSGFDTDLSLMYDFVLAVLFSGPLWACKNTD